MKNSPWAQYFTYNLKVLLDMETLKPKPNHWGWKDSAGVWGALAVTEKKPMDPIFWALC